MGITLPAFVYASFKYHVMAMSLLDSTWCGLADVSSFTIPQAFSEIHDILKCCRVILHVRKILQDSVESDYTVILALSSHLGRLGITSIFVKTLNTCAQWSNI